MADLSPSCEAVVAKVKRNALRIGGINGIRALSRALKIHDDASAETISLSAFTQTLADFGITLTANDVSHLTKWLDRTAEQKITPTEFIAALRVLSCPQRQSLVLRVWSLFPKSTDGMTTLDAITKRFDPSAHPQVIRGERSEAEVAEHFHSCFSEETNPQGVISSQEFEQYCSGLSAAIDSDDRFAATMQGCWHIPGFEPSKIHERCFTPEQLAHTCKMPVSEREQVLYKVTLRKALDQTIEQHRKSLVNTPAGFRALGCALRRCDPEGTGFLPQPDFIHALESLRLYVSHTPVLRLLDANGDGTVDYQWYLCQVVGFLPPARRLMAERLWRSFQTNTHDRVEMAFLHKRHSCPPGNELDAFLDAWDMRKGDGAKPGAKSSTVSQWELLNEWFVPVSVKSQDDVAFADYLSDHWAV